MVSLTCTGCKARLQIDDAFVGGVCRCQHCGAIQTVPSDLKKGATEKKVKSQKTLYRKSVRGEGLPSSGLDELAQVISGSGLSSGRLMQAADEVRPRKRRKVWVMGGAIVGLLALMAISWHFAPSAKLDASSVPAVAAAPQTATVAPRPVVSPNFCGSPLEGSAVVYVLDRGSGTQYWFSHLKDAAFRSVESLGPQRKFQIVFWDNGGEEVAYPLHEPAFALPSNIATARRELDGVFASGQTTAEPALKRAVASGADLIVLATGKGYQLGDDFVSQVMGVVGGRSTRVYTFDVVAEQTSDPLRTIAERTGGKTAVISLARLMNPSVEQAPGAVLP